MRLLGGGSDIMYMFYSMALVYGQINDVAIQVYACEDVWSAFSVAV